MTAGLPALVVLGALVLAVAALSAGMAATAATNRELRSSVTRYSSVAEALGLTGHAADTLLVTGRVQLADGSTHVVSQATIGQVIAAYGAVNPATPTPAPLKEQDPWTTGLTGSG